MEKDNICRTSLNIPLVKNAPMLCDKKKSKKYESDKNVPFIKKTRKNDVSILFKKGKLKLKSNFDHKGSKQFLKSKMKALENIIIDDEIKPKYEKEIKTSYSSTDIISLKKSICDKDSYQKKSLEKYKSVKRSKFFEKKIDIDKEKYKDNDNLNKNNAMFNNNFTTQKTHDFKEVIKNLRDEINLKKIKTSKKNSKNNIFLNNINEQKMLNDENIKKIEDIKPSKYLNFTPNQFTALSNDSAINSLLSDLENKN